MPDLLQQRYSLFSLIKQALLAHRGWGTGVARCRTRSPHTTSSSSAAAATAWRPRITWRRCTASRNVAVLEKS